MTRELTSQKAIDTQERLHPRHLKPAFFFRNSRGTAEHNGIFFRTVFRLTNRTNCCGKVGFYFSFWQFPRSLFFLFRKTKMNPVEPVLRPALARNLQKGHVDVSAVLSVTRYHAFGRGSDTSDRKYTFFSVGGSWIIRRFCGFPKAGVHFASVGKVALSLSLSFPCLFLNTDTLFVCFFICMRCRADDDRCTLCR